MITSTSSSTSSSRKTYLSLGDPPRLVTFVFLLGPKATTSDFPCGHTFSNRTIDPFYPKYGFTIQYSADWSLTDFSDSPLGDSGITLTRKSTGAGITIDVGLTSHLEPLPSTTQPQTKPYSINGYQGAPGLARPNVLPSPDSVTLWHPDHAYYAWLVLFPNSATYEDDERNFNEILAAFHFAQ